MTDLSFLRDAGLLREHLAGELVEWRAAGFWSLWRFRQFNRRVRLLARLPGLPRDAVYRDLEADADAIEAREGA